MTPFCDLSSTFPIPGGVPIFHLSALMFPSSPCSRLYRIVLPSWCFSNSFPIVLPSHVLDSCFCSLADDHLNFIARDLSSHCEWKVSSLLIDHCCRLRRDFNGIFSCCRLRFASAFLCSCLVVPCFSSEVIRPCVAVLSFSCEVIRLCLVALCFRREIVRLCLAALCFCREVLRVVVISCIVIVSVLHPFVFHLSSSDLLHYSLFLSCFSFSCSSILFFSHFSFLDFLFQHPVPIDSSYDLPDRSTRKLP